ncbi:hypothetical protein Tco_0980899 [Tanacetum coccineum]
MAETMEQYMSKTRADYGSGVARPKIEDKDKFKLKGQFLKELRTNTFSDQVMLRAFPMSLTGAASRWLRNKPTGSITTWEDLKTKDLDEVSSTIFNRDVGAIQAQLNNLGREIKKVNEIFYVAQVGCEQCKGPHYTKDCPLKEDGKTLEETYYMQFGRPFHGGGYRATTPEIRAATDAAIRNPGASIKTLEIQIEQMSKEELIRAS